MIKVYGIANCDTVKKARNWLDVQGLAHEFHDYKKAGVPEDLLPQWQTSLGWEPLINRSGSTWRKLDEAVRAGVVDAPSALALMLTQPSVIKRPVVDWGQGRLSLGFKPEQFEALRRG